MYFVAMEIMTLLTYRCLCHRCHLQWQNDNVTSTLCNRIVRTASLLYRRTLFRFI